jgi:transketolase
MLIAKTIKGYGASFMENKAAWHHKTPTKEELDQAMLELDRAAEEI